jgi:hypothetical protein
MPRVSSFFLSEIIRITVKRDRLSSSLVSNLEPDDSTICLISVLSRSLSSTVRPPFSSFP